jgi:hypothetical protein
MSLEDLGNIGDFVGGIAVIITLLYLAAQIRRNTHAARAATHQQWVTMTAQVNMALSESRDFARVFRAGSQDPKQLEPDERTQFNTYLLQMFNAFESLFFQAQQGSVDRVFLQSKMPTMRAMLAPPGVRSWWDRFAKQYYDQRFRDYVEKEVLY